MEFEMIEINDVLKELYTKFYKNLISYCRASGLTNEEAEDCVNEVFIRFWLNFSKLKDIDISKKKIWLYKACLKVVHEILRKRDKVVDKNIDEFEDIIFDPKSKTDKIIESDAYYQLVEAVRSELIDTDIERKIFDIMVNGELDLGYKELSAKYGINSSTLRSQVRRLRLKLEKNLPVILQNL